MPILPVGAAAIEHPADLQEAPFDLQPRPTFSQGLRGPARCQQQQLPPFLHQPLLLAPAPLQVLVMKINGSHGKTLRESASC
jgi:hypothetical protein